jgi:hypothetical protein
MEHREKRLKEIGERMIWLVQHGNHDFIRECQLLALETLRLLEEKETGREWF